MFSIISCVSLWRGDAHLNSSSTVTSHPEQGSAQNCPALKYWFPDCFNSSHSRPSLPLLLDSHGSPAEAAVPAAPLCSLRCQRCLLSSQIPTTLPLSCYATVLCASSANLHSFAIGTGCQTRWSPALCGLGCSCCPSLPLECS